MYQAMFCRSTFRAHVISFPQCAVRNASCKQLSCPLRLHRHTQARAAQDTDGSPKDLIGEDAAVFSLDAQTKDQWTRFFIVLGVVMGVLVRFSGSSAASQLQPAFRNGTAPQLLGLPVLNGRNANSVCWRDALHAVQVVGALVAQLHAGPVDPFFAAQHHIICQVVLLPLSHGSTSASCNCHGPIANDTDSSDNNSDRATSLGLITHRHQWNQHSVHSHFCRLNAMRRAARAFARQPQDTTWCPSHTCSNLTDAHSSPSWIPSQPDTH